MNIGMLWFDNDPQSDLAAKVERAATYYHKKYGIKPDLCFVHPSMTPVPSPSPPPSSNNGGGEREGNGALKAGFEIRATRSVMPNHLWIGINTNGGGKAE